MSMKLFLKIAGKRCVAILKSEDLDLLQAAFSM